MRSKSLSIPDARGAGASLRVTRHPEERKVVLSHWRGDVCVASTRVEPTQLPTLIGLLAEALGDAIETNSQTTRRSPTRWEELATTVRQWLRPRLAQISELRLHAGPHSDKADKEVG
jgi:hypothetical protein